jgi:hypothetical protein
LGGGCASAVGSKVQRKPAAYMRSQQQVYAVKGGGGDERGGGDEGR